MLKHLWGRAVAALYYKTFGSPLAYSRMCGDRILFTHSPEPVVRPMMKVELFALQELLSVMGPVALDWDERSPFFAECYRIVRRYADDNKD